MSDRENPRAGEPPVEELEAEAEEHNPDPTTRREAFELELMDEGRSAEGEDVDIEEDLEKD